jgi:hypothetical protein
MDILKIVQLFKYYKQCKLNKKSFFYISKSLDLVNMLDLLQKERCIYFYKTIQKSDNLFYFKIYINKSNCLELINFLKLKQYHYMTQESVRFLISTNLRLKFFFNTKRGLLTGSDLLLRSCGGLLLFGIKYV